ncbi:MAG TPA: CPBP family intramembrane glutamic endopeptidase, partial [Cellvibrio sp.]|nr:CPBP family intramembrane glutamic endopeptidase [Cellvibrio sp.]
LTWCFRKEELNGWIKLGLFLVLVPLAFWVATYRPTGFSYPLLFSLPRDGQTSGYDFYINFSKALAGFILLCLLWPRLRTDEFVVRSRYSLAVALIAPILVISLAVPVLNLAWQPKPIEQVLLFAAMNLSIVCVAEEVFMRFLFQQNLRNAVACLTANPWLQELLPLLAVTIIFVAIHAGLSGAAVWIYALAGFLYGLSYTLSKNIIYPIMVHFLVNQIHFSFLTYPPG